MKNETEKTVMRGELALLMVVVLNSLGVLCIPGPGFRRFRVFRMHSGR